MIEKFIGAGIYPAPYPSWFDKLTTGPSLIIRHLFSSASSIGNLSAQAIKACLRAKKPDASFRSA
jgi:hypothetical protein